MVEGSREPPGVAPAEGVTDVAFGPGVVVDERGLDWFWELLLEGVVGRLKTTAPKNISTVQTV